MDTSIRRVQPEAAIQHGAVRAVGPRRERGPKREGEFDEELSKHADEAEAPQPAAADHREHRPPTDGEIGSQLDVVG